MGKIIKIRNPYSGEIIKELPSPSFDEINLLFEKCNSFFQNTFRNTPAYIRAEILNSVSRIINENFDELAKLISTEGGKPLKDARIEVARAVNTVKMAADCALELSGEQISMDRAKGTENHLAFTVREPLGVVLAISAFNHPVNLICHQVACAIAAGNTLILKPAEKTPLSALKICEYFWESGLNKDALMCLIIDGEDTEKILNNKHIQYISFIGNASIGWMIRKKVNPGVKVQLEHGGTAPAVVSKHADLITTIPSIVRGAFYHSGQVCVSTQIAYVHSDLFEEFLEKITLSVSNLKTGDQLDENTDCGPLITPLVLQKINYLLNDAIEKGALIQCGGEELPGNCFQPTILTNVNSAMKVISEEVFSPILSLIKFDNIMDVIAEINSSKFAFQTAIYTKDIDEAFYYARNIDQKACIINDSTAFRVDWMPFGGFKESGFGTGGIKYAIEDMTKEKLIVIKNNF